MTKTNDGPQKGFFARRKEGVKKYTLNRLASPFIRKSGEAYSGTARSALTPQKLDRQDMLSGYNGRYSDGGRARFAELMKEVDQMNRLKAESDKSGKTVYTPLDLDQMAKSRRRASGIMFAGAALFFGTAFYFIIAAGGYMDVLFGLASAMCSFIFLALSAQHDFSRWQIQERRLGGFREYLKG
jgi:hypothetical protein